MLGGDTVEINHMAMFAQKCKCGTEMSYIQNFKFYECSSCGKRYDAQMKEICNHQWTKEYYLGTQTGDKVCIKCGETKMPYRL